MEQEQTKQKQEEYVDLSQEESKDNNMFNDFLMPQISIDDVFDRSLLPA